MRILVTGASGFVGQHLLPYLEKHGHDVYALKRPTTDGRKILTNHMCIFEGDIKHLTDYLKENKIDGVIHLASLYLNKHTPDQIDSLISSNILFSTQVLEAAVNANVKWFLNTGTIWQNYNVEPYSKKYCPVNLYAATKQAFIDIAKYYTETSKIRFCTLKLCDTYGPNDTRKKIYSLFEQYAKSGDTLNMSPGDQKLDIVHIDKVVVSFLSLALKLNSSEKLDTEYVVTSGSQRTLKQLASDFEKRNNVKLNINWGGLPYREREVMVPYIGNPVPSDK